jgi:hypothetical protein
LKKEPGTCPETLVEKRVSDTTAIQGLIDVIMALKEADTVQTLGVWKEGRKRK